MITPEAIAKLRAEAPTWKGTPHRNYMSLKGIGTDCVHFVVMMYKAAGLVTPDYKIPAYSPNEGLHNASTRIQEIVRGAFEVQEVSISNVRDGDLLVFKNGKTSGHVGIYLDGEVWHALGGSCVTNSPWVLWKHRIASVFRL